jgi:hypothetical protein
VKSSKRKGEIYDDMEDKRRNDKEITDKGNKGRKEIQ